ncbi:MerR family transcriptional regulator [Microbispora bryophytorum]|uniref:MerR family transcriptional regulator n=1 Tax=Microbispora bryophytorum TaxID=1460882 RepID=UPI001CC29A9F|nr:MerR family transcriptional regulator [Microbispora camponoti]
MSDTWTIGELAERAADLLSQERHVHGQEPQDDRDDGPEPGSVKGQEPRVSGPEPRANSPQQQANGPEQRVDGPQQRANGRVRELPNERLIRWYTTIGLLDPPLGRRGRVALYGRRHLLQLVAVKRRQAEGLSIAAIQAELTGATNAMLQRLAGFTGLPPESPPESAAEPALRPLVPPSPRSPAAPATASDTNHLPGAPDTVAPPVPGWRDTMPETGAASAIPDVARPAARDRFWARPASTAATADSGHFATANSDTTDGDIPRRETVPVNPVAVTPAPSNAAPVTPVPVTPVPVTPAPSNAAPVNASLPDVVHGVRLAPGVTLLLDPAYRVPDGHEVAALRRAAAPLLTALATLGLAGPFDGAPATHDVPALDPHASDTLER